MGIEGIQSLALTTCGSLTCTCTYTYIQACSKYKPKYAAEKVV